MSSGIPEQDTLEFTKQIALRSFGRIPRRLRKKILLSKEQLTLNPGELPVELDPNPMNDDIASRDVLRLRQTSNLELVRQSRKAYYGELHRFDIDGKKSLGVDGELSALFQRTGTNELIKNALLKGLSEDQAGMRVREGRADDSGDLDD